MAIIEALTDVSDPLFQYQMQLADQLYEQIRLLNQQQSNRDFAHDTVYDAKLAVRALASAYRHDTVRVDLHPFAEALGMRLRAEA